MVMWKIGSKTKINRSDNILCKGGLIMVLAKNQTNQAICEYDENDDFCCDDCNIVGTTNCPQFVNDYDGWSKDELQCLS